MNSKVRKQLLDMFIRFSDRDIKSHEDLKKTISASPGPYQDMQPRHLKGSGRREVQEAKHQMFSDLADKFIEYFQDPATKPEEFDQWHKKTCIWLTKRLQALCTAGVTVKPGKAQKLINMSLKHFFCFDSAEQLAEQGAFDYCHMPIDRYILSWYYREIKGVIIEREDDWRLTWKNFDYDEYIEIQKEIRNYLSDSNQNTDYLSDENMLMTPFEAEFYIWNEEKFIRAALRYRSALDEAVDDIHNMKCGTLKETISAINELQTKV